MNQVVVEHNGVKYEVYLWNGRVSKVVVITPDVTCHVPHFDNYYQQRIVNADDVVRVIKEFEKALRFWCS